jgi:hypothetical protein
MKRAFATSLKFAVMRSRVSAPTALVICCMPSWFGPQATSSALLLLAN